MGAEKRNLTLEKLEMDSLLKLNSGRNGRDKVFRAAQYALKLVNAFQTRENAFVDTVELEKTLASFRKLLRLGTCVDTAYGVKETLKHTDPVVRWTATLRRLTLALYLYYDHLVWLAKNEIIASEKRLPSYSRRSNQWWLCSLIVGLLRDVYEIRSILAKSKATKDFQGASEILSRNKGVFCDLLVNSCDASIPAHSLGLLPVSSAVPALLGLVSSIVAIVRILKPEYRMLPPG